MEELHTFGLHQPRARFRKAFGFPRLRRERVECPRCGSADTECLSAFGSTACKALYRCVACRESSNSRSSVKPAASDRV